MEYGPKPAEDQAHSGDDRTRTGPSHNGEDKLLMQVQAAADGLYLYTGTYLSTTEANRVVMVTYSLASYFAPDLPVFPHLCFHSSMPCSGKSTALRVVVQVGYFADVGRKVEKISAAALTRVLDQERKGVKFEDVDQLRWDDPIFELLVNSFPVDGIVAKADLKSQNKYLTYKAGGTPIGFTTNKHSKLHINVKRRTIALPMVRAGGIKQVTPEEEEHALAPIRLAFSEVAIEKYRQMVRASAGGINDGSLLPAWMTDPLARHRWLPLFAVTNALLGPDWLTKLEAAAKQLEGIVAIPDGLPRLLVDIHAIKAGQSVTRGATAEALYKRLREEDPERWSAITDTAFGRLLHDVQEADGRQLERRYIKAKDMPFIIGHEDIKAKKPRAYYWEQFEAVWTAYDIRVSEPEGAPDTNPDTAE